MTKYTKEQRPPPTPPRSDRWKAPDPCEVGDKDEAVTFAAVGRALSKWEELEHAMAQSFISLVGYGRCVEAHRAYGSIMANKGRLDMIEAAQEAFFLIRKSEEHQAIQKKLVDLMYDVKELAKRRNEIAHGIVVIKLGEDLDDYRDASYVLAPSYSTKTKRKLFVVSDTKIMGWAPAYEYSSKEINIIGGWFESLRHPAQMVALAIRRQRHLEQQASLQKSA
jgi:hypothetical protein